MVKALEFQAIFKLDVIKYYSNWVAIQKVFFDFSASITSSYCQVHLFIWENPLKGVILQLLVKEFKA